MAEKRSLDLVGIGEAARSIPPDAWEKLVKTACSTFEQILAPITETTSGIGRLIKAKFDRLTDPEKVVVTNTFAMAEQKAAESGRERNKQPSAVLLTRITSNAEAQVDPDLRDLWSNLLAREITSGSVHPEVADILAKLTRDDIVRLLDYARSETDDPGDNLSGLRATVIKWKFRTNVPLHKALVRQVTYSHRNVILHRIGLLEMDEMYRFELSPMGRVFLKTIRPVLPEQHPDTAEM